MLQRIWRGLQQESIRNEEAGQQMCLEVEPQVDSQLVSFSDGRRALHLAAWRASPEIVQLFLDMGVNAKDSQDATPLHYAVLPVHRKALSHQPENVKLLISQGAEVDARDSQGLTPLHWAASEGTVEAVEALLDAGADRQAQTQTGETPCQLARDNRKLEGSKALGTLCWP